MPLDERLSSRYLLYAPKKNKLRLDSIWFQSEVVATAAATTSLFLLPNLITYLHGAQLR